MSIEYFTPRPIPRAAIKYLGPDNHENLNDLVEFTHNQFRLMGHPSKIYAEVYDRLHDTWVKVKKGDYVMQGALGEFYPHDGELISHTHEKTVEEA